VGRPALDFRGHSFVRDVNTEVTSVRKALAAAAETGTMVNICHVSAQRTLDEVAVAQSKGRVACEATLHHLFFTADTAESKGQLLRVNPPLRSEVDRSSLVEWLRRGIVDFLVTDHAPHLVEEKRSDLLSGVPGLDNYGNIVAWLLNENGFDARRIASITSANQSEFFSLATGERSPLANGETWRCWIRDSGKW
jgi:dihydroorotase